MKQQIPPLSRVDTTAHIAAQAVLRAFACTAPSCQCQRSLAAGKGLTHCPSHDDHAPSLSVDAGRNGQPLVHCHAGCEQGRVWAEVVRRCNGAPLPADKPAPRPRHAEAAQEEAARRAQAIWEKAIPIEDGSRNHPYLQAKKVGAYGLRKRGDELLVPLRDPSGNLVNVQGIFAKSEGGFEKRFLKGGRTKGAFHIIGNPTASGTWYVAEGYTTGAAIYEATRCRPDLEGPVAVASSAGNLGAVARELRTLYPEAKIVVCADDDWKTDGNPGLTKAREAARAVGGYLAVPEFGENRPEWATDFNDLSKLKGEEAVHQCLQRALEQAPSEAAEEAGEVGQAGSQGVENVLEACGVLALSENPQLSEVEEVLRRAAKLLHGADGLRREVAKTELIQALKTRKVPNCTKLVAAALKDVATDSAQGQPLQLPEAEPWPQSVDVAELLDELAESIRRHVVIASEGQAAVALWVLYTHVFEAFGISPILSITSPTKRCGKTTLLAVLQLLVRRPLPASNVTPAALFRTIEAYKPTLLIDEADTFVSHSEELQGILNAGHNREAAFVVRTVGEHFEPRRFSVWCPKAIAAIGKLADTLTDRALPIEMKRKTRDEHVERLRGDKEDPKWAELRSKCARWAQDSLEKLKEADPEVPDGLHDREADNWRPLLAIADLAGGHWPRRAREAALALSSNPLAEEAGETSVELLKDIQAYLAQEDTDRVTTDELLWHLNSLQERPWPEWNNARGLTARQLAQRLKLFGIVSRTIRKGEKNAKGYMKADFEEAFCRYLPPKNPSQRHNAVKSSTYDEKRSVTKGPCDGSKNASFSSPGAACDAVTDRKGGNQARMLCEADLRHRVGELARYLGYPSVPCGPAEKVVKGEEGWEAFLATANRGRLEVVFDELRRIEARVRPEEGEQWDCPF